MSLTFALLIVIFAAIIVIIAFISGLIAELTHLPRLIFYLLAGIILGPIGFGFITQSFILMMDGQLLQAVVNIAVAIIVFEGGYSFNRCMPHAKACAPISFRTLMGRILRLSLIGGFITILLMTALFFSVAQFPFVFALLLGALSMITGPTVINPCVRQLNIKEEVGFTLEGEGLVNDALGVILASVIFSAILRGSILSPLELPVQLLVNLGFGALVGGLVGFSGIIVARYLTPRFLARFGHRCEEVNLAQLTRVGMLVAAFSAFAIAELVAPESGIISVLLAGILIGNRDRFGSQEVEPATEYSGFNGLRAHIEEGVHAFQSDLTKLAIAAVFILLPAVITRTQLLNVIIFGPVPFAGLIIVGALILFVRPLAILISTIRTRFSIRERLFMSFFGPRGIVIAATGVFIFIELLPHASYLPFDVHLIPSYIFLIVLMTVVIQAGLVPLTARACGVCYIEPEKIE